MPAIPDVLGRGQLAMMSDEMTRAAADRSAAQAAVERLARQFQVGIGELRR
jgi:hypothetical protein